MKSRVVPQLLALLLACSSAAAMAPQLAAGSVDARIEALELKDLDGRAVSLRAFRGRVVVLNFWATWCQPCVAELPLLADLARRYASRGLVIVAASIDDGDKHRELARIAAGLPAGMQVWTGATLEDMASLGVGSGVPATLVFDRNGAIEHRRIGALQEGDIDRRIEALLREGAPPKRPFAAEQVMGTGTDFRAAKTGTGPNFR